MKLLITHFSINLEYLYLFLIGLYTWKSLQNKENDITLLLWHNSQLTNSYFFRPPSFKQVTPTCRTNVRQLLQREQSLQQEQRNRLLPAGASHDGSHMPKKRQNRAISKDGPYSDAESYFKVLTRNNFVIDTNVDY